MTAAMQPMKHPPARLLLNGDLAELVEALDALSVRAGRLAKRVPAEYADPDYDDVIVEDLQRLRLNLREASGAISSFVIPIKKAPSDTPVEVVQEDRE